MEHKEITKRQFEKEVVNLFGDKAGCKIQHKNCPCNTCFHNIDADFRHICWLLVLYMRGDYKDYSEGLKSIKEELQ